MSTEDSKKIISHVSSYCKDIGYLYDSTASIPKCVSVRFKNSCKFLIFSVDENRLIVNSLTPIPKGKILRASFNELFFAARGKRLDQMGNMDAQLEVIKSEIIKGEIPFLGVSNYPNSLNGYYVFDNIYLDIFMSSHGF